MRRLTRNYWRTGWILLINGVVILLFLTGPLRERHQQLRLYEVLETAPPSFSYSYVLLSEHWVLALLAVLLLGMVAELRRVPFGAALNMGPYAVGLVSALWNLAKAAGSAAPEDLSILALVIVVLAVIVVIDAAFYLAAFRRMRADARAI